MPPYLIQKALEALAELCKETDLAARLEMAQMGFLAIGPDLMAKAPDRVQGLVKEFLGHDVTVDPGASGRTLRQLLVAVFEEHGRLL